MKTKKAILLLTISLVILNITGLNDTISIYYGTGSTLSILILIISLFLILLGKRKTDKIEWNRFTRKVLWVIFIYLIMATVSSLVIESDFNKVLSGYRYYLPAVIIYLSGLIGFIAITKYKGIDYVINLMRILFILNALAIIVSFFSGGLFFESVTNRFSGINMNANQAGYLATIALAFELFHFLNKKNKGSYVILPLLFLSIFFTVSKTSYLMGLIIIVYFLIYIKIRRKNKFANFKFKRIIMLIFVLISSLFVFRVEILQVLNIQQERITDFLSFMGGTVSAETTTKRTDLFVVGFHKTMESPLIGNGFETMTRMDGKLGVHNQYLLLWGGGGVIALFAYLYLLVFFYRKASLLFNGYDLLIRALILIIALYSMTNHNMYSNNGFMLVLAFITTIFTYNLYYVRYIR